MSNKSKDDTLGMPHGTANGKLKKQIMFRLLCKLRENVCFKCSKLIESVDDLSVEHKKPWEGISADLFWDLENIAFSHLLCNRPDRPNYGRQPVKYQDGKKWCSDCREFICTDLFWKNKSTWDGFQPKCKQHHHL